MQECQMRLKLLRQRDCISSRTRGRGAEIGGVEDLGKLASVRRFPVRMRANRQYRARRFTENFLRLGAQEKFGYAGPSARAEHDQIDSLPLDAGFQDVPEVAFFDHHFWFDSRESRKQCLSLSI